MSTIDYAVFFLYMVATLVLGFMAGRMARRRPSDYFLGEKKLPWYVVGTSMVASDISSETFIANVGIAYQYGMVVATQGWNSWINYSVFLFIFLPYYVRTGLYTMPQFLEQRYNPTCRYLPAISSRCLRDRYLQAVSWSRRFSICRYRAISPPTFAGASSSLP